MLGKFEGRRRRGQQRTEMVGWHHWLYGHEFEQALGVGDGQGSLLCCSPWGHKELNITEWLKWTELRVSYPKYRGQNGSYPFGYSQHHFNHILFVSGKSLSSTHIHGGRMKLHFFRGSVSKNLWYILKSPQRKNWNSHLSLSDFTAPTLLIAKVKKTPRMFPRLTSSSMIDIISNPSNSYCWNSAWPKYLSHTMHQEITTDHFRVSTQVGMNSTPVPPCPTILT